MKSRGAVFRSYYRPYRGLLAADLACALVVAATTLALPLLAGQITGRILAEGAPDAPGQIAAVGAAMLALVALHAACNTFVDYHGHMMGTLIERDMRRDLFAHYQRLSFSFYDQQHTGQLMSRITGDLEAISELAHHGPEDLAIGVLKFVGTFAILATLNLQLSLLIFLFFPVMLAYALYFNRKMNQALLVSRARIGDVNAQVEDTLAGIRVAQSFTNEGLEARKFAEANGRFVASRRAGYRSEAAFSVGMVVFTQLMTIVVISFGSVAILSGALGLPELVTYLLYIAILIEPIQRFVNFARLYQEGMTGFARFMELMELAPEIQDPPGATELGRVRGQVVFKDVSFQYREGYEHVLRAISLSVEAGEYIALVGPSGAGKTTLCALIARFYEVSAGRIELDGHDIRSVSLRSLRRNIGVVQQDVYLFAGTVAENIGYGDPAAGRAAIIAAARQANAHSFIAALPEGYDTPIGQRGVRLSGGQKQRLSLARVFLKDPPVLIFDEATSALDNESERLVQEAMERLAGDRTTLVIAHRLSTVRNARRIVVLTDEGIVEQGGHAELLARGGVYARLYRAQAGLEGEQQELAPPPGAARGRGGARDGS